MLRNQKAVTRKARRGFPVCVPPSSLTSQKVSCATCYLSSIVVYRLFLPILRLFFCSIYWGSYLLLWGSSDDLVDPAFILSVGVSRKYACTALLSMLISITLSCRHAIEGRRARIKRDGPLMAGWSTAIVAG